MKRLWLVALLAILVLTLAGCAGGEGFAFGAAYAISIKGCSAKVARKIEAEFANIDKLHDAHKADSDIAKINSADANQAVLVAEDTILLINRCFEVYEKFPEFNIAIRPLVELWRFDGDSFSPYNTALPTAAEIAEVLEFCTPDSFVIDAKACTVSKTDARAKLDFGAVTKGYAAGIAQKIAFDADKQGVIDVGGTVATMGSATVGILDPRGAGLAAKFQMTDQIVSTSGDYQRYFEVDGRRYAHILGENGYPANLYTDTISATVVCADGLMADILSTYIFIVGYQKGALAAAEYDASFLLLTTDGYQTFGDVDFEIIQTKYAKIS